MNKLGKLKAFTLSELLVAMVIFSMVMAASGGAIYLTFSLLAKQTDSVVSKDYEKTVCSYISEKVKYADNVKITSQPDIDPVFADLFSDGTVRKDIILYVKNTEGKIYIADGITPSGTPVFNYSVPLFDSGSDSKDKRKLSLIVFKNDDNPAIVNFSLTAGDDNKKVTRAFVAVASGDSGVVVSDDYDEKKDYYIFIDNG